MTNTLAYTFTMQPSTPTVEHLAACRAAARATLTAERFNLLARVDDPALADCQLTPDDDISIRHGSVVRILSSNPCYPEYVRVEKILMNDMVCVSNLLFPGIRRREPLDNLTMGLTPEAAEVRVTE